MNLRSWLLPCAVLLPLFQRSWRRGLGRGGAYLARPRLLLLERGQVFSLSPRERVGVRGKGINLCQFGSKLGVVCVGLALLPCQMLAQEPPPPLLRPPHPELPPTFWELHGGQIIIAACLALVLILLVVLLVRRTRPVIVEEPGVTARRALENLRGRAEDGALIVEVSRILKRFVLAALNLPPEQEQTTVEFRNFLKAGPQIKPELAEDVGDFLRRCDEWKFAPARPAPQLNAVPRALDLVEKIEQEKQAAQLK
jgi:Domain of unknown function (DUF4381)